MALDAMPTWLEQLFTEALLLDQVGAAYEWVQMTGCILSDLLEDDALTDLVVHLGLRKYEGKRLRKALKSLGPEFISPVGSPSGRSRFSVASAPSAEVYTIHTPVPSQSGCNDLARSGSIAALSDNGEPEPELLFQSQTSLGIEDYTGADAEAEAELLSPRKVLARRLLDHFEEPEEGSTNDLALGSIGSTFKNPADVFAAFEAFGPGAVAMFEFDEDARKFGLTVNAEHVFQELGISSNQSADKQGGVQHFLDELASGTIKKSELQQFLETFLGADVVARETGRSPKRPPPLWQVSPTTTDFSWSSPTKEACPSSREEKQDAIIGGEVTHTKEPSESCDAQSADAQSEVWCDEEPQSFAPTTRIEARVLMADASTRSMMLQKRVIDSAAQDQNTVLAFELRAANNEDDELLAQLDVQRILEIQKMPPCESSDPSANDMSFIITASADAIIYLQPGISAEELFHSPDTVGARLSLHVAVGPCESLKTEAGRYFDGLGMLARLPSHHLQKLANIDAVEFEEPLDAAESNPEIVKIVQPLVKKTLKVDLSDVLQKRKPSLKVDLSQFLQQIAHKKHALDVEDAWVQVDQKEACLDAPLQVHGTPELRNTSEQVPVEIEHDSVLEDVAEDVVPDHGLDHVVPKSSTPRVKHEGRGRVSKERRSSTPRGHREGKRSSTPRVTHELNPWKGKGSSTPRCDDDVRSAREPREILFNACHTRWNVVLEAAQARGWTIVTSEDEAANCNVHWLDDGSMKEVLPTVQPWMRVNHFPGTCRVIGRKARLARTMARMQTLFPDDYSFVPRTWVLPEDFPELALREVRGGDVKVTYIAKPDGASQGRGIFLTDDFERLRKCSENCRETGEAFVVQKYIAKPMLLDGLKFDMRIYLLVVGGAAGASDMKLFIFRDGLVRLCTTEYQAPTPQTFDKVHMHITNYDVNRTNASFTSPASKEEDGFGSKRSMNWLLEHLASQYGEDERQRIWSDIVSICVKTVLAAQPTFEAEYAASFSKDLTNGGMGCRSFEILGFDIMLDRQRKAHLIEVNHMPSFGIHSAVDRDVKQRLIEQTFDITCGCIDSHITNKTAYEDLLAGDQISASGSALIDLPAYKDFHRVFPPGEGCPPQLASLAMAISEKVRDVFTSVITRPRAARDTTPPPCPFAFGTEPRSLKWGAADARSPSPTRARSASRRRPVPSEAATPRSSGSVATPRGSVVTPRATPPKTLARRNSAPIRRSSSVPGFGCETAKSVVQGRRSSTPAGGLAVSAARKELRRASAVSAWSAACPRNVFGVNPEKPESTGVLKKSDSTGVLKKSDSTGVLKKSDSTGRILGRAVEGNREPVLEELRRHSSKSAWALATDRKVFAERPGALQSRSDGPGRVSKASTTRRSSMNLVSSTF